MTKVPDHVSVIHPVIDGETIEQLAKRPPQDLLAMQAFLDRIAFGLKEQQSKLEKAVELRYVARAKQMRASENKDTGTVRFEDNGYEIKADLPKKVEWDAVVLRNIFDAMDVEDAQHYAKVKIEVEESKYTKAPPAIQKLLLPARTVKTGKAKFEILVLSEVE